MMTSRVKWPPHVLKLTSNLKTHFHQIIAKSKLLSTSTPHIIQTPLPTSNPANPHNYQLWCFLSSIQTFHFLSGWFCRIFLPQQTRQRSKVIWLFLLNLLSPFFASEPSCCRSLLHGGVVEGTFMNPTCHGCHNPAYIVPPSREVLQRLVSTGGVRAINVAPEVIRIILCSTNEYSAGLKEITTSTFPFLALLRICAAGVDVPCAENQCSVCRIKLLSGWKYFAIFVLFHYSARFSQFLHLVSGLSISSPVCQKKKKNLRFVKSHTNVTVWTEIM